MRRMCEGGIVWALAAALLTGATGALAAVTQCPGSAEPKVQIVAYINVSSGCQEATVRYLKAFAAKHPNEVSLEIIDFGTEEGAERWHADGLSCQTIRINGATQFRVGSGKTATVAVFEMPEGVRWSFADLAAVLSQELRAPNTSAITDAEAAKLARQTPVAWRKTSVNGKVAGEVLVAAQPVFRFAQAYAGESPAQRAERCAALLKRLYAAGLRSDEIRTKKQKVAGAEVGVISARGRTIATVTGTEADVMNRPPLQVAQVWALNLRDALRLLGR